MQCAPLFLIKIEVKLFGESRIAEMLQPFHFTTAGPSLGVARAFFSLIGSGKGKEFNSWISRVETVHLSEQGWYLGA